MALQHSSTSVNTDDEDETIEVLNDFKKTIADYYRNESDTKIWYPLFSRTRPKKSNKWVEENYIKFLKCTPNQILQNRWYSTECGYITTLAYSHDGERIVVGHANGLIQMRHGHTGAVLATLRNIQYPPKPVYAIEFSHTEERVCYAGCIDGSIYRVEIPNIDTTSHVGSEYCIKIDPRLEWLNTVFFGSPGQCLNATPFLTQRTPVLSMSLTSDGENIIAGHSDSSVKVIDINTQAVLTSYKVHKVRLQFVPKRMQRVHTNQVVAVRCHQDNPRTFASAGWDKSLRIWDLRCKIGCMMTFEDVDVVHDSIDINRQLAITGSWTSTEGLSIWDLTARKRLSIVRVQNRRPDVDGDYYYTCRYWMSSKYNRKGKYCIVGGSGTGCVEVINLHNRYITGSFPAAGTILAVASHEDRIAFGGTAPVFNIVSFHDPKHEEYFPKEGRPYDYSEHHVSELDAKYFQTPDTSVTTIAPDPDLEKAGSSDSDTAAKPKAKPKEKKPFDRKKLVPYDISINPIQMPRARPTVTKVKPPPTKQAQ